MASQAQQNQCPDRETPARGIRQRVPRFCDHHHSTESFGAAEPARFFLCPLGVKDQADVPCSSAPRNPPSPLRSCRQRALQNLQTYKLLYSMMKKHCKL